MSRGWFRLELTLHSAWQIAERVRSCVRSGLMLVLPEDETDLVGMVVGELLENAIKYGDFSGQRYPADASRLALFGTPEAVDLSIEHPVTPGSTHAERLFAILARLDKAKDPEQAYIEMLQEVAVRSGGEGGLGLARISYEGRCRLQAERLVDQRLRVWTRIEARMLAEATQRSSG